MIQNGHPEMMTLGVDRPPPPSDATGMSFTVCNSVVKKRFLLAPRFFGRLCFFLLFFIFIFFFC